MHQLLEAGTTFYTAAMTQLDVSFAIKRKTYDIVISVSIYIYITVYQIIYKMAVSGNRVYPVLLPPSTRESDDKSPWILRVQNFQRNLYLYIYIYLYVENWDIAKYNNILQYIYVYIYTVES